jgi:PAS domain S-box-containing protein
MSTQSTNAAPLLPRFRFLYNSRLWIWCAIILSFLVCAVVALLYCQQRQTVQLSLREREHLRQARIELGKGFLQLSLAGKANVPFNRAQGLALLRQAVVSFEQAQAHLPGVDEPAGKAFRDSVARFQGLLGQGRGQSVLAPTQVVALRVAFDDLDRQADRIDTQIQRHLLRLTNRLDRNFALTLTAASLLLALLCCVVFSAGRIKDRFAAASRESDDRFRKAMAATSDGLWDWNVQTGAIYFSPAYWRMLGYEPDEIPDTLQDWVGLLHPDDLFRTTTINLDCIENRCQNFETEFRLRARDGSWKWILGRGEAVSRDGQGRGLRLIGTHKDITERKRAEAAREATIELLRICNGATDLQGLLHDVLRFFQERTECEAVAVRVRSGDDFPYYETLGFPADFVKSERSLCAADLADGPLLPRVGDSLFPCICGAVINGQVAAVHPFFTERGSFRVNSADELLAGMNELFLPGAGRNRCLQEGYASLALVPLRTPEETFGLFQFCDRRPNRLSAGTVSLLEDLAGYVAMALAKLQVDDALMDSCQFSQQVINSVDEGVIVLDCGLRYQVWNPYMEQLTGVPAAAVMGRHLLEAFPEFSALGVVERAEATLAGRKPMPVDLPLPFGRAGGGWIAESNTPLRNRKDEIIGVIVTVRDVTDWRLAQGELREASRRLQLAVDAAGFGLWDWDIVADALVWDERMFALYGVDKQSFSGDYAAWLECLLPNDRAAAQEAFTEAIAASRNYEAQFRIMHPDGTVKTIKATGTVIRDEQGVARRMIGFNQDITDKMHMEEQLRQAQKMEAIGQLAGGVAHDFNNILTVVYGYCYMLQSAEELSQGAAGHVEQIIAAAERATNLTRGLLAFSRKQSMCLRSVNLNDLIINVVKLLTRIIGEDIHLKTAFHANPLMIHADGGQIEQVLMNLSANARDAMPHGGSLTIETGLEEMRDDFVHAHGYGVPGNYVVLSVSDTGEGMDAETSSKIFEPFFTTKEVGKGTGLGLAIAYGVVKQHNGYITVCSEPGKGTTFTLYLPTDPCCHDDTADLLEQEYPRMGTETVLIAEDDPSIRQLAASVMKKFGYEVIFALDGAEAVEKFLANGEKIALVVLDMIMPSKNGKEAFEEIRLLRPDVPVLFMSGYSPDLLLTKGILQHDEEVLVKPFHPLDLVRKVRVLLDHRKRTVEGSAASGV